MDSHYAARLVRFALKDPGCLTTERKFWKVDFFPYYLRRAENLIWHDPQAALTYLTPAPAFAARIAETDPTANGADYMILGHSYLGAAYRRLSDYPAAEDQFKHAGTYREKASPKALAEYLRHYASQCIELHRAEAFDLINEAIAIHKRGNLVNRHQLGECLVCRGVAYYEFNQPDKILDDFTAALNHLSIKKNPIPYYVTLHNLAVYAVRYGSDDDVRQAIANLKPARGLLTVPLATTPAPKGPSRSGARYSASR